MSPIKGLTDRPPRLPRIGKIHLGVKVTTKKDGTPCAPYPRATNYFVFDPKHPQYDELVKTYGDKPAELRILLPIEDEAKFASQFYRLYSMTRGLVCKGDGEEALRMIDSATGSVAVRDTKDVAMKPIPCQGRDCPDYGPRACGEVMNLQFILPEVSGFGVWQIDTGSINSIINVNSALELVRGVYGRVSMVPLILALEPKEVVNPDDGKKKTVRVLNIRSQDKMIEAYRKAQMPPLQLIASMVESGEIGAIEAEELPPAGDEPPYADLPEATEVGPSTDTDPWPTVPVKETPPVEITEGILWIGLKDPMPAGSKGMIIGIKETKEVMRWKEHTAQSGSWVKDLPEATEPVTKPPPAEETTQEETPDDQPWPGMSFNELISYVKRHKKTEGWLFKTFGFNVATAKEKPYECACEVQQMISW